MLEFLLGSFLGYSLGKTIGTLSGALREPDRILKWDPQCLGYRPVSVESLSKEESYLLCYEVKRSDQER